ncbi:MAG: response regulator [Lewinellaceae bacterium]|nr:response regulator [Lewinellaceae bacterium]
MNIAMPAKTLLIFLASWLCSQFCLAQIHVKSDANGKNDGTSWQDAFTHLQDALTTAKNGDEIWVAAGTYLPGKPGDPETSAFLLTKNLRLYGGFSGTESSLSEREFAHHPTILSGDLNQDDIAGDFKSNRSDNVWNILLVKNETAAVPLIDGFTFEGGHADGEIKLGYESRGGGIFTFGPVELRNCQFRQNYAKQDGGAVFFWDSLLVEKPKILNPAFRMVVDSCRFEHNYAGESGGAMCQALINSQISASYIGHSVFSGNKNLQAGGALEIYNKVANSNIEIKGCIFEKNIAELGGAVICIIKAENAITTFSDCHFWENIAVDNFAEKVATGGGAIRFTFFTGAEASTGKVKDCTFSKNTTELYGGALSIYSEQDVKNNSVAIDSCFFDKNESDMGGAIAFLPLGQADSLSVTRSRFLENKVTDNNPKFFSGGGAIGLSYWGESKKSYAKIEDCMFEKNESQGDGGGAIVIKPFSRSNFSTILGCTFLSNHTSGKGGALLYDNVNGNYKLEDCTFRNNKAEAGGDRVQEGKAVDISLFFLFYQGALWMQVLYSLVMFLIARERTMLYYALVILGASLFSFSMHHIYQFSFYPNDFLYSTGHIATIRVSLMLIIFSALKFAQHYLNVNQYYPRFSKIFHYYIGIYLCYEFLNTLHYTGLWPFRGILETIWTRSAELLILIGLVTPFVLAFLIYRKGFKPAKYLLPAFIFIGFSSVFGIYINIFYGQPNNVENMVSGVFNLLAIIAVGLANGYRTNLLKKDKERAEKLAELDTAKTRLYTNITHEFRTPLTVIMGASDMVKGNEQEKKLIQRNSRQLLQLINQMLDLSKLEAGALILEPQQGDIVPFLEYIVESFQSLAASKHIQLTFYRELDELVMDFDAEKVQQIVTNLLSNAIKFTPESGKVVVHVKQELRKQKPTLMLKVRDNGKGIAEAALPHVFDRFYQADATDARGSEGTGIGLALVKELVQLMNGEITVTSVMNKGSEFTVAIPVTKNAPVQGAVFPADDYAPAAAQEEEEMAPIFQPPTDDLPLVLIVEDNRDVVSFIKSCLRRKYRMEVARNGKDGIEKALDIVPDIIISDVMMPEKDGYTLCRTLKEDERTSHVPIILLTAKATQEDRVHGLEVGADAYLSKPFDREELEVRLQKLIELRRQLQARYQDMSNQAKSPASREDIFIQKLRTAVEENMEDESFGITELCQAVGLSRMQVHRKLKALTGIPATQFIHSIRLQKAHQLLLDTDLNVSEVAYQVGFSDHSYFTKLFVKEFGVRPSEVREG